MLQKRRLPYPDETEWFAIGDSFGWAFRERQVVALVACDVERKRAALDLGISVNTLQLEQASSTCGIGTSKAAVQS